MQLKVINMCSCFQSSLIPLQLSSLYVDTNVGSENSKTEPVERSPWMLGTSMLEAFPSCLLLYSHMAYVNQPRVLSLARLISANIQVKRTAI